MEEGRQAVFYLSKVLQKAFPAPKRDGEQVLTEVVPQFNPEKPVIMPCYICSAVLPI